VLPQPRAGALVWSTDLKLGHLPAVCVKTGRPADASVKFRFVTAPRWAYVLLLLICTGVGFLVTFVIMRLVSRAESGRLPYVKAAANRIRLWRWSGVAAVVGIPVLLFAALFSLSGDTTIAALVWSAFLADLLGAITIQYLVLPIVGPSGYVHDSPYSQGRWVELRRVHPAFAAATAEMYAARWAAVQQPALWQQLPPTTQAETLPPPPA
jgi:hypothetical protein